ncbi:MAG: hypothetical protein BWX86_02078 [Verrucomicrobia bacterium ADurb.Bin122]|nr:MAG: hypothetical protein BWX86_02078 [Verrucomicrobia bacterium ADurb.Bin122]
MSVMKKLRVLSAEVRPRTRVLEFGVVKDPSSCWLLELALVKLPWRLATSVLVVYCSSDLLSVAPVSPRNSEVITVIAEPTSFNWVLIREPASVEVAA